MLFYAQKFAEARCSEVMLLIDKVEQIAEQLNSAKVVFGQGMETAIDEAVFVVSCIADLQPLELLDKEGAVWMTVLTPVTLKQIDEAVKLRITERKPMPYIVGESVFCGNKFWVDDRVIIPRSYLTEWITENFEPWIDSARIFNVLDLCTGSGCIAISTALAMPWVNVVATDLSAQALEVADKNIQRHGVEKRVKLINSDCFDRLAGKFDLILCNPPYVSDDRMDSLPDEFLCEPRMAFHGGSDGLDFLHRLLAEAAQFLTEQGCIIVESGSASAALEQAYPDLPFNWLSTEYDEMVVFLLNKTALTDNTHRQHSPTTRT